MLNPFFLQGSKGEQNLIQDLINEQLKIYGVEVHYMPRRFLTTKTVIREVIESSFRDAYPIEAYIENYNGYEGPGTILSKFGIQDIDTLTLVISRDRYETYMAPLMRYQNIPNLELIDRPKEGDLIYFPLGDRLFEIKYVEHEQPFYQLNKNYVYVLTCELFRYSNEDVDTTVDYIDDNVKDQGYIETLHLVGSGSTAHAYTGLVDGAVYRINITNRGSDYTEIPKIVFEKSPLDGGTAEGEAVMIDGLVSCNGVVSLKVQSVVITNPGYGYTVAPKVISIGGGNDSKGFSAEALIGNGVVGVVTISDGGSGYIKNSPPSVSFTNETFGDGGLNASGISSVSVASTVYAINMTNRGKEYLAPPTIVIGNPVLVGSGNYENNEYIIGSTSGASAKVNSWNKVTKILTITKPNGAFVPGETITGQNSEASYKLSSTEEFDKTDTYSENEEIQIESNKIMDFSEKNPFGNP
jgi:hypothetical protein